MLEIYKLVKVFNEKQVLDEITLNVTEGVIFGFLGTNGAGKSTTINILTGALKPTSGKIKIFGYNYNHNLFKIKQEIGVVPETLGLFESLTGVEHLEFVGKIHELSYDEIKCRINELMELFDLSLSAKNIIDTYSHGMKKKLSFSSAIIHTPKLLFLDEPFENVDPISRKIMKDILKKMKDNGTTIFITSHALTEVEEFCDEIAIINEGKIVYQSATKDIRNKIKDKVTQETYLSLEDIFIDLTTEKKEEKAIPTWL